MVLDGGSPKLVGHVSLMNGYAAVFFADPSSGVGVAVLGNSVDAELLPGGRLSVADRVFEWLTEPVLHRRYERRPVV